MSNIYIDFQAWDVQQRSYITRNVLLITTQLELIGKKEFAAATFDLGHEVFVVHVTALNVNLGNKMHPLKRT